MQTNPALWSRLKDMRFDEDGAPLSAARRLARENGWSPAFAERVLDEYRRFAYLAIVAGHEVTPSDEVDQAWHLHLTYTRHYWGPFTVMLGAPLHHGPTRGTGDDKIRYEDNYAATLASYEREFGKAPPADIWPPAHIRFGEAPNYQRINTRTHLVIELPAIVRHSLTFLQTGRRKLATGVAAAGLAGLSAATAHAALQDGGGASLGAIVIIVGVAAMLIGLVAVMQASSKHKADQKGDGSGGGYIASDTGSGDCDGGDGGSGCGAGCGGCGGG